MSARKKAEPKEVQATEPAETPATETSPSKSTDKGGLAELQARADQITARGYTGPTKESTDD